MRFAALVFLAGCTAPVSPPTVVELWRSGAALTDPATVPADAPPPSSPTVEAAPVPPPTSAAAVPAPATAPGTDAGAEVTVDGGNFDNIPQTPPPSGVICTVAQRSYTPDGCTLLTSTETADRFWYVRVGTDFYGGITTDSPGMARLYNRTPDLGAPYWTRAPGASVYTGALNMSPHVEVVEVDASGWQMTVREDASRLASPPPGCDLPEIHVTCSGTFQGP